MIVFLAKLAQVRPITYLMILIFSLRFLIERRLNLFQSQDRFLSFSLKMPSTEPFIMDTLSLALTGGPNGYKINLKDMEVYGASNFSVKSIM